jgi:hypothetical protein
VVYGVLVFVATLPGAVVLVVRWRWPGRAHAAADPPIGSDAPEEDGLNVPAA